MKKNDREQKTVHHRKPRSKGGTDHPSNISHVKRKFHEAWHLMFADKSPLEIAELINEIWLDPEYYFMCVERKNVSFS